MSAIVRGLAVTSIMVFSIKVIGAILSFIISVIVARELGLEMTGVYFFVIGLLTMMSTLVRVGTDTPLIKQVAVLSSSSELGKLKYAVIKTMLVITFTSFLVVFFAYIFESWIVSSESLTGLSVYLLLGITGLALAFTISNTLVGIGLAHLGVLIVSVIFPCVFLLVLGVLKFFCMNFTVGGILFIYSSSIFLVMFISTFFLWYKTKNIKTEINNDGKIYNLSKVVYLSVIIDVTFLYSPLFILEKFSSSTELSLFSVCLRVATVLAFVFVSINKVFSPKIATLYAAGDYKKLFSLIKLCLIVITSAGFAFLLINYFLAEFILNLFGEGFVSASNILWLFIAFQITCSLYYFIRNSFQLTGNHTIARKDDVFLIVTSIALSIALIPTYGAFGAILGLFLSSAAVLVVSLYQFFSLYKYKWRLNC